MLKKKVWYSHLNINEFKCNFFKYQCVIPNRIILLLNVLYHVVSITAVTATLLFYSINSWQNRRLISLPLWTYFFLWFLLYPNKASKEPITENFAVCNLFLGIIHKLEELGTLTTKVSSIQRLLIIQINTPHPNLQYDFVFVTQNGRNLDILWFSSTWVKIDSNSVKNVLTDSLR